MDRIRIGGANEDEAGQFFRQSLKLTGRLRESASEEARSGDLKPRLRRDGRAAVARQLRRFGHSATPAYSRNRPTLLVFWNPDCGYCQKLLPDLRGWATKDSGTYALIMVSTGSPEANLSLGIPATILLDHEFALGRDFNVQGTPSAIVIAPDGTIGSGLAVGGNAVMSLAGTAPVPRSQRVKVGGTGCIGA